MNRYTIYCTPEQTKKAFELGAPIGYKNTLDNRERGKFDTPTAEQMLNWLEEKYIDSITIRRLEKGWEYTIIYNGKEECLSYFSTRKEVTLAAIDAALEYLTNNKK